MFLNALTRRNPEFIKAAVSLHQEMKLPSNCCVLDLDAIEKNASYISNKAATLGITTFGMSKQIGRHKPALDAAVAGGIKSFVTVDIKGFRSLRSNGHKIGHAGHLVQIPAGDISYCLSQKPEFWTVFNKETLTVLNNEAQRQGLVQKIFLRIYGKGDNFYEGHAGGIPVERLESTLDYLSGLGSLRFAGLTTFPCLLYNDVSSTVEKTHNLKTLSAAAKRLHNLGLKDFEVNAPGTTSVEILPLLAEEGVTQIEPGHGLTGTTPLHAVRDLVEIPGVLYLSELAHLHQGTPYFYGGGLYIDPVFPDYKPTALSSKSSAHILDRFYEAQIPPYQAIDYYGMLHGTEGAGCQIGDSVILGFRPQAFVRTSYIASIKGISRGNPELVGISDSNGGAVQWP
ncbi:MULTISPECIES: alanine racemase [unclassified Oceanispirochaeta]|uniref:alanine racemase n=1 Tax=unclassified Oceanispirochaeta TaxID=2635722 RepID=UPI000E09B945|nr:MULTISPECIES: alanine racemase [unclassified Oceanispirochaeta]MBF9016808.1 alanine racemase [Oceanispirochaeta sp. M2]NPD72078.1 YhfX family PLP-dependent enzyme [Oceanispirochaeta sp. M1]RDG32521.1 YhfX family PLP-dependent enzyme [Oceanispirochaeta sp. M1]